MKKWVGGAFDIGISGGIDLISAVQGEFAEELCMGKSNAEKM
jgi:hypothetical protein